MQRRWMLACALALAVAGCRAGTEETADTPATDSAALEAVAPAPVQQVERRLDAAGQAAEARGADVREQLDAQGAPASQP